MIFGDDYNLMLWILAGALVGGAISVLGICVLIVSICDRKRIELVSERNQIKGRKCKKCGGTVKGKAFAIKDHARTCDGKQQEKKVICPTNEQT